MSARDDTAIDIRSAEHTARFLHKTLKIKTPDCDLLESLSDLADYLHDRATELEKPEPVLIQGYTAEQWQEIIDGGYWCEFFTDHSTSSYFDELKAIGIDGRYVSMNRGRCHTKCRPAQIKGVMRPIFVEPEDKDAFCHFFKGSETGTYWIEGIRWSDKHEQDIIAKATKYIEV